MIEQLWPWQVALASCRLHIVIGVVAITLLAGCESAVDSMSPWRPGDRD